jgi:hypothetical protein
VKIHIKYDYAINMVHGLIKSSSSIFSHTSTHSYFNNPGNFLYISAALGIPTQKNAFHFISYMSCTRQ